MRTGFVKKSKASSSKCILTVWVRPAAWGREILSSKRNGSLEVTHNAVIRCTDIARAAVVVPWAPGCVGDRATPVAILDQNRLASCVEQGGVLGEVSLATASVEFNRVESVIHDCIDISLVA